MFAPLTWAIVWVFQQVRGLKLDGVVGPVTRSALGLQAVAIEQSILRRV
ncbi:MAG: hypothetical protein C3F08_04320 [Candidatus Methylomirabilota bacterium]|nr:MAG: hypothetical protein C3F08_04320 [candidate division NC10 bacterium]